MFWGVSEVEGGIVFGFVLFYFTSLGTTEQLEEETEMLEHWMCGGQTDGWTDGWMMGGWIDE